MSHVLPLSFEPGRTGKANNVGGQETRRRIIEVAGPIFADHGYHAPTIRQITERAGVNLAAINYHFRDKEELYFRVLQHAYQAVSFEMGSSGAGSPAERLRAYIQNFLRLLLDPARPEWHGRLVAREMSQPTPALDQLIEQSLRPRCNQLRAILTDLLPDNIPWETRIRIGLSIVGQCLIYSQNRASLERLFPEVAHGENAAAAIAEHITRFSLAAIEKLIEAASCQNSAAGPSLPQAL